MNEALKLAEEMQRYGVTTMNRWATDGAAMLRSQHAEIEILKQERAEWEGLSEDHQASLRQVIELRASRDEYQRCADDMAAAHKVERDAYQVEADKLAAENKMLRESLESIALAGMSGSGQESEEGIRNWHAHRAWEFIGIAARALGETK